jgi:hypothetical protein
VVVSQRTNSNEKSQMQHRQTTQDNQNRTRTLTFAFLSVGRSLGEKQSGKIKNRSENFFGSVTRIACAKMENGKNFWIPSHHRRMFFLFSQKSSLVVRKTAPGRRKKKTKEKKEKKWPVLREKSSPSPRPRRIPVR